MKHLSLCVALALGTVASVRADEKDVRLDQVPAAVQAAMKKLAGSGAITNTSRETEKDGTVLYEVAYKIGEKKFEAEVSASGEVVVVDEQVTLESLPPAVRAAIEKATASGKIGKVEKASKGEETFYEAEFTVGDAEHEVQVALDGTIIARE